MKTCKRELHQYEGRRCKECLALKKREKRAANPQKIRDYARNRKAENPEKFRAQARRRYAAKEETDEQREKRLAGARQWYANNKKEHSETGRKWRVANSGKVREYRRRQYAKNPEKSKSAVQNWRHTNPEHFAKTRTTWLKSKPLYAVWLSMNDRCNNPNSISYKNYGGRGITVCEQWRGPGGYEKWFADMGPRPSEDHEIDRIDNNGNYEPTNVRWTTRIVNAGNKRDNLMLTYNGETLCASEWSRRTKLRITTIVGRKQRHGWSDERTLTTPPPLHKNRRNQGAKRLLEHNGKMQSLAVLAEEYRIPYSTLLARIDRLKWPLNKALTTQVPQDDRRNSGRELSITYNGKTQSLAAWARDVEVPINAMRNRLNRGWTIQKALTTPVKEPKL